MKLLKLEGNYNISISVIDKSSNDEGKRARSH